MDLPITFRNPINYRMETLNFEVVGFHGTYHAILGHPCYAKFMIVPNYTYLKLKMSGPRGVIIVDTSFQCAYECEVECYEHAAVIVASKELGPSGRSSKKRLTPRVVGSRYRGGKAALSMCRPKA